VPDKNALIVHHLGGNPSEVPLLSSLLHSVTGREVRTAPLGATADITIVHIAALRMRPRKAWASRAAYRFRPRQFRTYSLRRHLSLLGATERVLVVSKENLQHYAWRRIGGLLFDSDVPRLTFFPKLYDPVGERFPYWWNFVDWAPDEPSASNPAYGRLYNLERLMSPLPRRANSERLERACAFVTRYEYPRKQIVEAIDRVIPVDVFGKAVGRPVEQKLETMSRYRYAVASENSLGFGYETEKIPESWDAGCVPLGVWNQPIASDFNSAVLGFDRPSPRASDEPLLSEVPDLSAVKEYVDALFR